MTESPEELLRLIGDSYETGYRQGCENCLTVLRGIQARFEPPDRVYRILQILIEEIEKMLREGKHDVDLMLVGYLTRFPA